MDRWICRSVDQWISRSVVWWIARTVDLYIKLLDEWVFHGLRRAEALTARCHFRVLRFFLDGRRKKERLLVDYNKDSNNKIK